MSLSLSHVIFQSPVFRVACLPSIASCGMLTCTPQMLEDFGTTLWKDNPPPPANQRDGGLRDEFVTGARRGTGVFGRELEQGALAFISDDARFANRPNDAP